MVNFRVKFIDFWRLSIPGTLPQTCTIDFPKVIYILIINISSMASKPINIRLIWTSHTEKSCIAANTPYWEMLILTFKLKFIGNGRRQSSNKFHICVANMLDPLPWQQESLALARQLYQVHVSAKEMDILLLGCCTRFSCTLMKWCSQLDKIRITLIQPHTFPSY